MANRLYPTNKNDQHANMRQVNAVLAVGHVGCELKDFEGVTSSVLTILQQRFHHPPSPLDANIVDQFASILLTGKVQANLLICI